MTDGDEEWVDIPLPARPPPERDFSPYMVWRAAQRIRVMELYDRFKRQNYHVVLIDERGIVPDDRYG